MKTLFAQKGEIWEGPFNTVEWQQDVYFGDVVTPSQALVNGKEPNIGDKLPFDVFTDNLSGPAKGVKVSKPETQG